MKSRLDGNERIVQYFSKLANGSLSHAVTRRLLIVWLPIIIVGVVIFWLSGGMPPASWLLLLQIVSRWNGLQAALGNAFFISFAIVLMQGLFILIAWIILAFTIWREISVFNTLRAQQRIIALQEKLVVEKNTPIALQSSPVVSGQQGVQLMPEKREKNTGIKIVSVEGDDAFDVDKAVFELSSETDESEAVDPFVQPQQVKEEEETTFLYANPFEGELPEVFRYDMDLKRGVQSLQEELRGQHKESNKESIDMQSRQNKDMELKK
jgi:hypothetical protein